MSSDARALASRRNGAKSRGPRTAAGKARSSRNALKHGLCAQKILVLPDEDAAAFKVLEAELLAELAPVGALQAVLAQRVVSAAWRLARVDRTEAEVLAFRRGRDGDLGLALMRDGNGTRSVETLLRYRGAALAEFLRTLRTLQTLQAEARTNASVAAAAAPIRKRRLHPRRNEPTKARQIKRLNPKLSAEPPVAPARDLPNTAPATPPAPAPTTKPNGEHTPPQPLLPTGTTASAHQGAPERNRPDRPLVALRSPVAATDPAQARRKTMILAFRNRVPGVGEC